MFHAAFYIIYRKQKKFVNVHEVSLKSPKLKRKVKRTDFGSVTDIPTCSCFATLNSCDATAQSPHILICFEFFSFSKFQSQSFLYFSLENIVMASNNKAVFLKKYAGRTKEKVGFKKSSELHHKTSSSASGENINKNKSSRRIPSKEKINFGPISTLIELWKS